MNEDQRERRQHVIDAVNENRVDDLRAVGWWQVWGLLVATWPDSYWEAGDSGYRRRALVVPYDQRLAWAYALGGEPVDMVRAAVETFIAAGAERAPNPPDVVRVLHPERSRTPVTRTNRGQPIRPDQTDLALAAVKRFVHQGELICRDSHKGANLLIDSVGVLRCPVCGGLEEGQVDAATEEPWDDDDTRPLPHIPSRRVA